MVDVSTGRVSSLAASEEFLDFYFKDVVTENANVELSDK